MSDIRFNIRKARILVVDDKLTNLESLTDVLEDEGYRVQGADCGKAALEAVRSTPPDLILLDIMMPGMDGLEVSRTLKNDPDFKDIPIIFLTARDQTDDVVRGFENGAADYIIKPVNVSELLARVKTHLTLRSQTKELQTLAEMDGLTHVANRRRFDDFLNRESRRTRRESKPLSLLMIDIDFFKEFNDNYGHLAGDDVLKQAAIAIKSCIHRPGDLVARYGGEEFAVILGETDQAAALEIAERIRSTIQDLGIVHGIGKAEDFLTVSIGCATNTPGTSLSDRELIATADRQLYLAKESGRNTVR